MKAVQLPATSFIKKTSMKQDSVEEQGLLMFINALGLRNSQAGLRDEKPVTVDHVVNVSMWVATEWFADLERE